jgi:glycosyltransferase involved in cell wall biosynthesis
MKILIITERFHPLIGGAETILRAFARLLGQLGHEACVVTGRFHQRWPKMEHLEGTRVDRVDRPSLRWVGTAVYLTALRRYLMGIGRSYPIWYVSMLKHSAFLALHTAKRQGSVVVLRAEGGGATGDAAWQSSARLGSVIRRTCQQAAAIVVPSQLVYAELQEAGYDPERLVYIPNAVDTDWFVPPSEIQREKARERFGVHWPTVGYTGRLESAKGMDDLLQAWPEVRRMFPKATLLLAGPKGASGHAPNEPSLGVRYLGPLLDVRPMLHALDLYVLPSYFEGISMGLLEAMACGVPPVVSDIPGNREVVRGTGTEGWLVPPRRPQELAHTIIAALQQGKSLCRISRAARQRVEEEFSMTRFSQRHLELFEKLWAGSKKNPSLVDA